MEGAENKNIVETVKESNGSPLLPIENLIYMIRGQQVMIDSDLARLYGVETKRLKEPPRRSGTGGGRGGRWALPAPGVRAPAGGPSSLLGTPAQLSQPLGTCGGAE